MLTQIIIEPYSKSVIAPQNPKAVVINMIIRLSLLVFFCFTTAVNVQANDVEKEAYNRVVESAKTCSEQVSSGQSKINCWVKAAPAKCGSIVLDMFHDRKNRIQHRNKLYSCIATCVDAGFISRNFGQCSSDL